MDYHVIYDGDCNLCVTFIKLLGQFDSEQQFDAVPMQDQAALQRFGMTEQDCQMGIILIEAKIPENRWQGTVAVEEIVRLLPMGKVFIEVYRFLPGGKWIGDRTYEQIRDNRYTLFGKRNETYFCQPKS
jgi:predicted DCC family thiol-disulfide oxidoreductase YuxK